MAKLVILIHEYDAFRIQDRISRKVFSPYLLFDVVKLAESFGHSAEVARGPQPVNGDVAILHVDSTIVAPEYLDFGKRFERTINFATGDISKRKVSRLLVSQGDGWDGPVMVKSNFNNNAAMEDMHNRGAAKQGRPSPHPGVTKGASYQVLQSASEVEESVWSDDSRVVERFIPEPDPDGGFVLRTWVFMGLRERCTRFVTEDAVSKAGDVLRYEPAQVPPQLRAERERLGFDFGKFDFVMHEGEPVLLDANRTPGVATTITPMMKEGARNLAEGLHGLLTGEVMDNHEAV